MFLGRMDVIIIGAKGDTVKPLDFPRKNPAF